MDKLKVGIVGYWFARDFARLFSLHPDVEKICVAELRDDRRKLALADFPGIEVYESFDEMMDKADINCIALFTPRHTHGPFVIKALKAGKHVYSAVPIASSIEDVKEILRLVEETRLTYMMGETCYYYPCSMFCREKYNEGGFGKFVYAESQYYHDAREMWPLTEGVKQDPSNGIPPMYYSTHSISMVLSAIDDHFTHVSCMGLRDDFPDEIYGEDGQNQFNNPFSNETALFRTSQGGVVRINEFRRVGIKKPSSYITCFYGEDGAYECVADKHIYQTTSMVDRNGEHREVVTEDVSEMLLPIGYTQMMKGEIDVYEKFTRDDPNARAGFPIIIGASPIQDLSRLPKTFRTPITGHHMNSHPFLIDDFVRAVVSGKLPPNNAWAAARYLVPGLVAHESAMQGGKLLDIPDFGDAPSDWEKLTFEKKDYYENCGDDFESKEVHYKDSDLNNNKC